MSDLRPKIPAGGAQLRIGYESAASWHELDWPSAAGDCGPVDEFGHETFGGPPAKCIVCDAKGRVLLRIDY